MSLTDYVSYLDPQTDKPRIGHYNFTDQTIQPLTFPSGTRISSLNQIIEAGPSAEPISSGPTIASSSTKILPPITGRDILCVGKNYAEHAREFNTSGFDSSDKVDQPSHPVIFTKRYTSIIAHGDEILPHPEFTQTLDYEGEIGVIIGKAGYRIKEEEAMNHVWGYTIINDVTARERQRDHKQFHIGKSADTYCPMGPVAVPASALPKVLHVQTRVNGELRQDATTSDLIFSVPVLIKTMSEGQTLMPGDVLATGTPAGVGFGQTPPTYLKPGDTISISVTGLGTLTNRIASPSTPNPTLQAHQDTTSSLPFTNTSRTPDPSMLTTINDKNLYYRTLGPSPGPSSPAVVFIHGLGATSEYFTPLISTLSLDATHTCHLFDLEGQGLSPAHPLSTLSISSFAADLNGIYVHANISSGSTLVAHSMGCLVASSFCLRYPEKVEKLVLLGPPPSPLPEAARNATLAAGERARMHGMPAVVDGIVSSNMSEKSRRENPLGVAALRLQLLNQDPEGFAKACTALAASADETLDIGSLKTKLLIVTGSEDKTSTPDRCKQYVYALNGNAGLELLWDVGHCHVLEDPKGVADAIEGFLK